MQMFPAYTAEGIMNMYAITFFSLLNEGYRVRHAHYHMLSRIVLLPHVKKDARGKFLKMLEYASKDPSDILRTRSNNTDMSKVRDVLGGK